MEFQAIAHGGGGSAGRLRPSAIRGPARAREDGTKVA